MTAVSLMETSKPHEVKMSSFGVMSNKEASNNPGLCPFKGQKVFAVGLGPTISFQACL